MRSVKVVNDMAEHGVKLIADFATIITTDPAQRHAVLQGIENHHMRYTRYKLVTNTKITGYFYQYHR